MLAVLVYKVALVPESHLTLHLRHEWRTLVNIFGLLVGFEVLSNYFSRSNIPAILPRWLPDDWKGPLVLLALVLCASMMPVKSLPAASWPTALGLW